MSKFQYSKWRHGGYYVHNVRYPNGGCGCVAKRADGRWYIACDPRAEPPSFGTRDEAAQAEADLIAAGKGYGMEEEARDS